jgi:hypothetical protein
MVVNAITMADQKHAQRTTQTQKNKTIFLVGVIRVVDQLSALIDKN